MKVYIVDWQAYFGNGYAAPVLTNCRQVFKTMESAQKFIVELRTKAEAVGTHISPTYREETVHD